MELRSVEELMDLLYACRGERAAAEHGSWPGDLHGHALRTAALLRRRRPADKEAPGRRSGVARGPAAVPRQSGRPDRRRGAAAARRARRPPAAPARPPGRLGSRRDDLVSLRQADEEARTAVFDAGVLEDWRTVLELTAARNSRLGAVD